jgi:hypothetical protein
MFYRNYSVDLYLILRILVIELQVNSERNLERGFFAQYVFLSAFTAILLTRDKENKHFPST